jgi:RNA polymerase sigma-70 factor (ECF subfamily)
LPHDESALAIFEPPKVPHGPLQLTMADSRPSPLRLVALPRQPPPEDDAQLVERARNGAVAAQAELFRRHAPPLLQLLTRLLAATSDAEDALQDTFITAFADLVHLRDSGAFPAWLRRIAVHQAHRRFRKRRLLAALGLDHAPTDMTLADLADPDAGPDVLAELARLDQILLRLSAKNRTAWILRYVEGCELTEVASSCGCSLATAKRRVAAAQARVARHFDLPGVDE